MNSKILVTGAAGFIGSHLVETLVRSNYSVRAFVHYNSGGHLFNLEKVPKDILDSVEVIAGDIADSFAVAKAVQGCDFVCHLAALIGIPYSYIAPAAYVQTNIVGTLNILEACRRFEVKRLIQTSTSETYGTAQYVPIDENHPMVGQSPYSATKIAADKLVESFGLSFGLPITIVRPFNTYGPRQSLRAVIPTIIMQALKDCRVKLGNLDPVRDLTYVTDTANGFLSAIKSDKVIGETVNLGVGRGISIKELVDKIGKLLGMDLIVDQDGNRYRPEKSEVMKLVSNNNKAASLMGWSPAVDIETGLTNTIEFFRSTSEYSKAERYNV